MNIKKLRSKEAFAIYSIFGIFVLLIALTSGCSFLPKEEPVLAPPLVEPAQLDYNTAEVTKGEIIKRAKGTGTMVSTSNHDLYYSQDGSRLKEILAKEGDMVEAGQVLAKLETDNLAFDIEQVGIDLKKAEIRLEQLRTSGADRYSIEIGNLDVDSIKSRLSYMDAQMAESKITAPSNGRVTFVSELRQGEIVPSYQSILRVSETSELQILYTAINEHGISEVNLGMEAVVEIKGEEIIGEVVQTPKDVPSELSEQDPELYAKSVMINVEELPEDINVGEFVSIDIITAKNEDALIIPINGLRTIANRDYVQVMEGNTRREVDIEVGIISTTEVEVLEGLNEGDIIILK